MQEDLDLAGFRFNWALTVFYMSYLMLVLAPQLSEVVATSDRLLLW